MRTRNLPSLEELDLVARLGKPTPLIHEGLLNLRMCLGTKTPAALKGARLPRLAALTLVYGRDSPPEAFPGKELFDALSGLSAVQSLALTECGAGPEAMIALLGSPVLGRLRELVFAALDCLPVAEVVLAHADRFRGLNRLALQGTSLPVAIAERLRGLAPCVDLDPAS